MLTGTLRKRSHFQKSKETIKIRETNMSGLKHDCVSRSLCKCRLKKKFSANAFIGPSDVLYYAVIKRSCLVTRSTFAFSFYFLMNKTLISGSWKIKKKIMCHHSVQLYGKSRDFRKRSRTRHSIFSLKNILCMRTKSSFCVTKDRN